MILKIDEERHEYIIEDLDEETLVIKETQLQNLKIRLKEVRTCRLSFSSNPFRGDGMVLVATADI